jgi:deoxyhypusine synthase
MNITDEQPRVYEILVGREAYERFNEFLTNCFNESIKKSTKMKKKPGKKKGC